MKRINLQEQLKSRESTRELLISHGWKFVSSHDEQGKAVPDCWVHDEYPTQYNLTGVYDYIRKDQLDKEMERLKTKNRSKRQFFRPFF